MQQLPASKKTNKIDYFTRWVAASSAVPWGHLTALGDGLSIDKK
ncbi:unnamed protein product [marine sediment metagenome]|uniref:Uncharacterized protein n=1 Tax=marine sediment metagenome TaxID=412755 RepID=X0X1U6_9ZZZZ